MNILGEERLQAKPGSGTPARVGIAWLVALVDSDHPPNAPAQMARQEHHSDQMSHSKHPGMSVQRKFWSERTGERSNHWENWVCNAQHAHQPRRHAVGFQEPSEPVIRECT
eukprot:7389290-Prymnesium_polylepis.1